MAHHIVTNVARGVLNCVDCLPVACMHPGGAEGAQQGEPVSFMDRLRHLIDCGILPCSLPRYDEGDPG